MVGRGFCIGGRTSLSLFGADVSSGFSVWLMVDVRRDGRADGECDFTSDECQKPGCICRVKRENTVVENGKIPIVVGRITSCWPAEKKELLGEIA